VFRVVLVIAIALAVLAPQASAQSKDVLDIPARTCNFQTSLHITGELKQRVEPFHPAIADVEVPLIKQTKFYCMEKGNTTQMRQWNLCRKKAYQFGMRCMRAISSNPKQRTPPACQSEWGHHEHFGSLGTRAGNYEGYLRHYACVAVNRWFDAHEPGRTEPATIRYQIHVKAYGDKGCGGERTKKSVTHRLDTHSAVCLRQRNPKSYVSLPGKLFYKSPPKTYWVSYKTLKSSRNTAYGCQTACRRDKRCLAWMFHRKASELGGRKHSPGECELVDEYLLYEPSTSVDSGMK
jgi:hypothetical protein